MKYIGQYHTGERFLTRERTYGRADDSTFFHQKSSDEIKLHQKEIMINAPHTKIHPFLMFRVFCLETGMTIISKVIFDLQWTQNVKEHQVIYFKYSHSSNSSVEFWDVLLTLLDFLLTSVLNIRSTMIVILDNQWGKKLKVDKESLRVSIQIVIVW